MLKKIHHVGIVVRNLEEAYGFYRDTLGLHVHKVAVVEDQGVKAALLTIGSWPKVSESFRTIPKASERKESHTLTVREVARMFETAGVARTERSIVNWCQPNGAGIARLDAYLDPNEGKYFITPQSAGLAIKEEQAKFAKASTPSEDFRNEPQAPEPSRKSHARPSEEGEAATAELQKEIMDLKINNRAKDYFIEQLQKERESFADERQDYVEKLMTFNRKLGELETKVLQLEAPPEENRFRRLNVHPANENLDASESGA
jgi:catechol 2,3-dioxygenase-like lactoylglutathione lyase family enzyme